MANYYYLVASLPDLMIDGGRRGFSIQQLFMFCMDEMSITDFEQIKRLFLFNDIKNAVFLHWNKKQRQEDYIRPAYYDETTFNAYKLDTVEFWPFLSRFYELKKANLRPYPHLPDTDELTVFFYEDLDSIAPEGFLREYFLFELNLRNISSAINFRKSGQSPAAKLIPVGTAYEMISKQPEAPDFGLSDDFPYIGNLMSLSEQTSLMALEKAIEDVRWTWLDDQVGNEIFSTDMIISYFVKMESVERWYALSQEKGDELFNGLMTNIKRSIRFSIEFMTTGVNK